MTEPKFTPAPWEILNDFGVLRILNGKGSAIEIAQIKITGDGEVDFDEAEANANLIAAAPELYEVLQLMEDKDFEFSEYECRLARKALAKARGET